MRHRIPGFPPRLRGKDDALGQCRKVRSRAITQDAQCLGIGAARVGCREPDPRPEVGVAIFLERTDGRSHGNRFGASNEPHAAPQSLVEDARSIGVEAARSAPADDGLPPTEVALVKAVAVEGEPLVERAMARQGPHGRHRQAGDEPAQANPRHVFVVAGSACNVRIEKMLPGRHEVGNCQAHGRAFVLEAGIGSRSERQGLGEFRQTRAPHGTVVAPGEVRADGFEPLDDHGTLDGKAAGRDLRLLVGQTCHATDEPGPEPSQGGWPVRHRDRTTGAVIHSCAPPSSAPVESRTDPSECLRAAGT